MRLVGFGCSFTFGSELIDPEQIDKFHESTKSITWDSHHENLTWRESKVWLGQLANNLNFKFDNRGEPANSNYAIAQQVSNYFLNIHNPSEEIIICVGWTAPTRMSWYGTKWVHNGFAGKEHGWPHSAREWVSNCTEESHRLFTDNAKFIVNSICIAKNIPIIQFNALGTHETTNYPNYYLDGSTMDSMLRRAMSDDKRLDLFASGYHPNEAGQEYFTIRLTDFVKSHIIKQ